MEECSRKEKNKKILVITSIVAILVIAIGATYAFFTYSKTGLESKLIAGDIYMRYRETSNINLSGAMPSATYPSSTTGNYFEFQITGKNTSTRDITYNVKLAYGDEETGKDRLHDNHLLFKLVEVINNEEVSVTPEVNDKRFDTIPGATLYTATIPGGGASATESTRTFRVYARINENVVIGNTNQDYTIAEWNNSYASVKINVDGGFVGGGNTPSLTGAQQIISTYGTENAGGLVGINKNGELYDPNATGTSTTSNNTLTNNLVNKTNEATVSRTDNTTTIREYRFSGNSAPVVGETSPEESSSEMKNYIWFNNERWRIVGIFDKANDTFEDENDEYVMKIVRNDPLSDVPSTYTNLSNKEFQLNYGENTEYPKPYSQVYWNYDSESNYNNNWTQAGLMYYLNENNTGSYYNSIASNYKSFIDETTYYLGNISATAVSSNQQTYYLEERNTSSSNIHEGNSTTWTGKIGLLYPSDYVYSFPTSEWNSGYENADNWMNGANTYGWRTEWFLSPSAYHDDIVMYWDTHVFNNDSAYNTHAVHPVLNLKSDTTILSGTGTYNNPYRIVVES